jgi:hypothetical protein
LDEARTKEKKCADLWAIFQLFAPPVETVAFLALLFFGLTNLYVFHRFKKPLLPLLVALFLSFFVFFLNPVLGLLLFLLGQTLAFYAAGKR